LFPLQYTHTAPQDDWAVSDYGQVAPPRSSDVDSSGEKERDEDDEEGGGGLELDFSVTLDQGVGLSLINSVPEELVFGSVEGVHIQFSSSRHQQCINLTVQNLQVDNQLATSHTPILAYPTPFASDQQFSYPVIKLFAERVPHKSPFATVFKVVEVKVRGITLLLEERLLFKLIQWAGLGGKGAWSGPGSSNEDEEEIMKMLSHRSVNMSGDESVSRQLYIETLSISETELRVSMYTTSQLPEDLLKIKKRLGLPLVKFESPIFLSGFHHYHILDSPSGFADALGKHYKGAVRNQALKILGSVDFLGNPVGLVSDVASGVAVMIDNQDVVGLVRDVTHGMSDTTSKLTGTVSHVLGQATFDSSFQEEREQVQEQCQTSGDHLKAGIIGLSSGVFGGMTSIFTQPYRGAVESGVGGFITGVGKGLLGTVAKPVAGLFDLASGTSAALRETMSRVSRLHPPPVRHRRCCIGSTGTLTCYSEVQARGQEYLLRLNDGARDEKLVSYELLNENPAEPLRVIISSQALYFFRDSPPDPQSLSERIDLNDLQECRASSSKTIHSLSPAIPSFYIVMSLVEPPNTTSDGRRSNTKLKCSKEEKAIKVAQLINYAKNLHEEEKRIVRTLRLQQDTIW
jgi:vacuolar protein sorting-associated protein 13D